MTKYTNMSKALKIQDLGKDKLGSREKTRSRASNTKTKH